MAENLEADVKVLELSTNLVGTIYNKENALLLAMWNFAKVR